MPAIVWQLLSCCSRSMDSTAVCVQPVTSSRRQSWVDVFQDIDYHCLFIDFDTQGCLLQHYLLSGEDNRDLLSLDPLHSSLWFQFQTCAHNTHVSVHSMNGSVGSTLKWHRGPLIECMGLQENELMLREHFASYAGESSPLMPLCWLQRAHSFTEGSSDSGQHIPASSQVAFVCVGIYTRV